MIRRRVPRVKFAELFRDGLDRDKKLGLNNLPRKMNRLIGSALAWIFLQTTITANQVTILLLISYYVGVTLLALGGYRTALVGIALILFGDALDLADGIVGRRNLADGLRKNKTDRFRVGLLASEHHEGTPGLVLLALSINYLLASGDIPIAIIGFVGALFEAKTFHLFRLRDYLVLRSDLRDSYADVKDTKHIFAESPAKQMMVKFLSFPLFYLVFIVLAALLFGQVKWALLLYGIYIPLRFLAFFIYVYIRFKKLEDSRAEK